MLKNRFGRLATATVLASAAMIVVAQPASAQESPPIPAGQACTFPLRIDGGEFPPLKKSFTDKDGNQVTVLAGKSGAVTYTNDTTEESVSFKAGGTHFRQTTRPDGTFRWEFSGHIGIILFPTDVPAGPSTTQMTGHLVIENSAPDASGFFVSTVVKQVGKQTNVCAALS